VTGLVCIQVNTNDRSNQSSSRQLTHVSSPEPGQPLGASLTPTSHHSPDSTRYSTATSNSGHTTQSSRSGYVTQLSVISETDREVADLNNFSAGGKMDRIEMSLSTDRNVTFGDYVELADSSSSINPPRDGASFQADRFFEGNHVSKRDRRGLSRLRTLPTLNKRGGSSAHSPTTVSSASANTNSSSSSMGSEPPKIVSYIDRKQVSDLTSLHNRGDCNASPSPGMDSSPSDQILVNDSDVVFEGAEAPKMGEARKPRPMWPGKGLHLGRKIRSLPPRSPHKGLRSSTTPPPTSGGSPAYSNLSPPGQMLDRLDANSNLSTPSGSSTSTYCYTGYPAEPGSQEVVRLSPSLGMSSSSYVMVPRGLSPIAGQAVLIGRNSPRTYEETSIEIVKSHYKDDNSSLNSASPLPMTSMDHRETASG
jgi:hypothetical protein